MQELDTLKALEDPAQGWMIGWLAQLVRNRLTCLDQTRAEPMLGQAVDQQAEDHNQAQCHDALGLLEEHRGRQKQGVFEEAKATFNPSLRFVRGNHLLVAEAFGVQDIGADNEAGRTQSLHLDPLLVDGQRHLDLPLGRHRCGALPRATRLGVRGVRHHLGLHLEPGGAAAQFLLKGSAGIGFHSENAHLRGATPSASTSARQPRLCAGGWLWRSIGLSGCAPMTPDEFLPVRQCNLLAPPGHLPIFPRLPAHIGPGPGSFAPPPTFQGHGFTTGPGCIQLPHIGAAVDAAIGDVDPLLFALRCPQLLGEGLNGRKQRALVTAVAIQRAQKHRDIALLGGA